MTAAQRPKGGRTVLRIAIFNKHNSVIGGIETYLTEIIPELVRRGHTVILVHEHVEMLHRRQVAVESALCIETLQDNQVLRELTDWKPDVVFVNSFSRVRLVAALAKELLVMFFAHDYVGTCISGEKRHKFPRAKPCARRFGPSCLLHYFPRRCGGWSPATMWREFSQQRMRLAALRAGIGIVTVSEAMRAEYIKHGFAPARVYRLPYIVKARGGKRILPIRPWRLLFIGRMEPIKGGELLLDAIVNAAKLTGRQLRLVLVGDGRSRADWEVRAQKLRTEIVEIEFTGWLESGQLDHVLFQTDLLVIPSTWPEPHGLVGLEAGAWQIPAVAFDVGGISEWLRNGINGILCSGSRPSHSALSKAIAAILNDTKQYQSMCQAALEAASNVRSSTHTDSLLELFDSLMATGAMANAY